MVVVGQLRYLPALTPRKIHPVPLKQETYWCLSRLHNLEKRKLLPLSGIKLRSLRPPHLSLSPPKHKKFTRETLPCQQKGSKPQQASSRRPNHQITLPTGKVRYDLRSINMEVFKMPNKLLQNLKQSILTRKPGPIISGMKRKEQKCGEYRLKVQ